jgi:hypothetical protein
VILRRKLTESVSTCFHRAVADLRQGDERRELAGVPLFVFPDSLFLLDDIIARADSAYLDKTFRGDGYD